MKLKDFTNKYIFLIVIFAIISFYQVFFGLNCMINDIMDISFPWRYFIGESLQNNQLPLWNPYQYLGFSQHSDNQTWYPISWVLGYFSGYSIYTLQFEFVLHIIIAGIGMFKLGKAFNLHSKISFFMAIVYMLSGFFVSNAQHLGWIVSAAWIPWIFTSFINFKNTLKFKYNLELIFYLFLLYSGGYFAFFIIIIYALILLFFVLIWNKYKIKNWVYCKKITLYSIYSVLIFICLSIVVTVSMWDIKEFVTRGIGFGNKEYLLLSYMPSNLITLFFPYSSMANIPEFWKNDISMINIYIGIISIIIFFEGIMNKKSKIQIWILAFAFLALLTAFGKHIPIRQLLNNVLPFFEYFRFPSLFRLFTMFGLIIFIGFSFNQIHLNNNYNRIRKLSLIFSIVMLLISIILFFTKNPTYAPLFNSIKIQSFIFFCILLSMYLALKFLNKIEKLNIILFFVVIEMVISVQMNLNITVTNKNSNCKDLQSKLNTLPKGFELADNDKIIFNNDNHSKLSPLWKNTNIFLKKIAYDGYNPYQYNDFVTLENSKEFKKLIDNKIAFTQENDKIEVNIINPTKIECKVFSSKIQEFTLMQNYYIGWKAYIDDSEVTINKKHESLMSITIPQGEKIVTFEYKPKKIIYSYYVSLIAFLIVVILLFYYNLKDNKSIKYTLLYILTILFIIIFILFVLKKLSKKTDFEKVYFETSINFEEKTSEFNNVNIIDTLGYKSNKSNIINKNNPYSATFESTFEQKDIKNIKKIKIESHIYNDTIADCSFVVELSNADSSYFWYGYNIKNDLKLSKDWNKISAEIDLPKDKINTKDKIKVYLWSNNGNTFFLDDFKIKLL